MAILEVSNITKKFHNTSVLKDISFSLEKGNALAIIGSSGSGKTTLLRCLNFLETPNSGVIKVNDEVLFDSNNRKKYSDREIREKRLHFGMVFQNFNLFPQYTALENVMLAEELIAKESSDYKSNSKEIHEKIKEHAIELLTMMGLKDRVNHYPHQLSGGQQQRVAIARALINNPKVIFADEPTGNLDSKNSLNVFEIFKSLCEKGTTIIVATHDKELANLTNKIYEVKDGKIQ